MKIDAIIIPNTLVPQNEVIRTLEKLSLTLPKEYIEFLVNYNGGVVRFSNILIKIKINDFETESYLGNFFSITEFETVFNIFYRKNKIGIDDFLENKLVAIATDNGGDNICICLSEQNFGNIFHWGGDFGAIKIADNLQVFFDSLKIDEVE